MEFSSDAKKAVTRVTIVTKVMYRWPHQALPVDLICEMEELGMLRRRIIKRLYVF